MRNYLEYLAAIVVAAMLLFAAGLVLAIVAVFTSAAGLVLLMLAPLLALLP